MGIFYEGFGVFCIFGKKKKIVIFTHILLEQ